jgi:hypothetical protein
MKYPLQIGRIEDWIAVSPDSNRAPWSENPPCLGEECFRVEPVKRLSDRNQVDGVVR